jgi:hypothetical protein
MTIHFQAFEYTTQGDFQTTEYTYSGKEGNGWEIFRNSAHYLTLGKGYRLLRSRVCGICATGIDRRFLSIGMTYTINTAES